MYYIKQTFDHDCGFTCLKMLLARLNHDENYLFLPLSEEEKNQMSYQQIIEKGQSFDLQLEAFKIVDFSSFSKEKHGPFLAGLKERKHLVLVTRIAFGRVFISDPDKGNYSLTEKKFLKLWDTTVILVNSFQKKKCPSQKPRFVTLLEQIAYAGLEAVSLTLLSLGLFYFDNGIIPLVFIPLSFILQAFILRFVRYMVRKMDRYDTEHISEIEDPVQNGWEKYTSFLALKEKAVTLPSKLVSSVMITAIVVSFLMIQGVNNYLYALSSLIIALFHFFFFTPFLKEKERKIAVLEQEIRQCGSGLSYKEKIQEIHQVSEKYLRDTIIIKVTTLFCLLFVPIGFSVMDKTINLSYLFCYFFLSYFLEKSLVDLFSFENDENEYFQELNRYLYYQNLDKK